jgi:hypothetical protein
MPIQDQLKKAIIQMPQKEKDKLLLRLITKDSTLTDKLFFELIEESSTIPERREAIMARITKISKVIQDLPGWILMDMKNLSGDITYHVKVTKDKQGGLELNLFLLNTFLDKYAEKLRGYSTRTDKIALYIVKKAQTILNGFNKLDEDYHVDYRRDVNLMLKQVYQLCSKNYARQLNLPETWE